MSIIKKENTFAPIVITPPASLELPDFRELWEYRGLLFFLIWRDLKLRFQQTVIALLFFIAINGNHPIGPRYLLIPVLLILTALFASGVGLLFGALMVIYRDMKNLLGFIMMIWMYASPIMYPASLAPEKYRFLFY